MTENPLGYEKIPKLLKNFAVPSIVASLVGSIYNIVDQIFIGQGVGYLGNVATNVAYPFSTICLAIALLVGIGSASRVSLCLGCKEPKAAAKAAGNGIVLMGIFGIIYLLVGETFLSLLLKAFGATTDVFPYAKQYASITLIGMPFLIVTNGMSNLIRADGALQDAPVPCHHHRARCRFHAQKARERAACRARTCIFPRRTIVSKLHGVCRGALLLCVACGNGACIYAARR